jgi:hypothetical protein
MSRQLLIEHGPLNELVVEPANRAKILESICNAVQSSFRHDRSTPTEREVKRRCELCLDVFERLRGDFSWSCVRIADVMALALRHELEGVRFEPGILLTGAWSPETLRDPFAKS